MSRIERSAIVSHSAERMFALVCDVQSYPEFLPWCVAAHLVSETEEELVAGMTVSKGSIKKTFTTRNQKQKPDWMTMELVNGPFSKFDGRFTFKSLNEDACKITFELDFEVEGKILSLTLGPIFKQASKSMVDAFVKRADAVYGA
ncbi:type II toxin-antitoxin system RatA family toxin [Oceaniserpentilla sp. 4NH20-0058]|uniref:type II toxin-antitoxin system RatA family toxin n=1 Tax=Oceaniserpentilla sp. 4NH20-0058 TaxID=3127660 RepID=UPI0031048FD2